MTDKTTGGAFSQSDLQTGHDMGMTLRDWFAGQALAGLCSGFRGSRGDADWFEQGGAKVAYRMADAMIAARNAR